MTKTTNVSREFNASVWTKLRGLVLPVPWACLCNISAVCLKWRFKHEDCDLRLLVLGFEFRQEHGRRLSCLSTLLTGITTSDVEGEVYSEHPPPHIQINVFHSKQICEATTFEKKLKKIMGN
jgi:hypothetical protein